MAKPLLNKNLLKNGIGSIKMNLKAIANKTAVNTIFIFSPL